MNFSRHWAMPNADTFSVKPIGEFVQRYLRASTVSVDPFARNKRWATHTNDLNPETAAEHHMDAEAFLKMLIQKGVKADLVIFDPPYSPRQISECYKSIGLEVGMKETQNAALYARVREAIIPVLAPGAVVLSFGWNSAGMGTGRGFEILELMTVCHGAAHNDTICIAERKTLDEQNKNCISSQHQPCHPMLEQEIINLTTAIAALDETLRKHVAPLLLPTEPKPKKSKKEEAPAPAPEAPKPEPVPETSKAEPEPAKVTTPVEVVEPKPITIEDLRAVGGKLVAAGKGAALKEVLKTSFGVEKLSALPADKYDDAHAKLSAKL